MLRKLGLIVPALAMFSILAFPLSGDAATAKAKARMIVGKIAAVNADGKSITVKEVVKGKENGKQDEIAWNDQTKLAWKPIPKDKSAPTAADLKADDEVTVKATADADGKLTAVSISIKHAA
jgi:hypothetical protein